MLLLLLLLRGVLPHAHYTHTLTHPQRFLLLLCRHPFGCQINLHSNCSSRPSRLGKLRRRRGAGGGRRLEMGLGTRHVMAYTVGVACATTSCTAARGASSSVILSRCGGKNPDRRCRYLVFFLSCVFSKLFQVSQSVFPVLCEACSVYLPHISRSICSVLCILSLPTGSPCISTFSPQAQCKRTVNESSSKDR